MMMAASFFTFLLLSSMVAITTSQTFQYSRGWTNGKRTESSALGGIPAEFKISNSPIHSAVAQMNDVPMPCQLQKLKLLLQGDSEQLYLLPCELLNGPRIALSELPSVGHFRRSSTLDNNNY